MKAMKAENREALAKNEAAIARLQLSNEKAIGELQLSNEKSIGKLRTENVKAIGELRTTIFIQMVGVVATGVALLGGFIAILQFLK